MRPKLLGPMICVWSYELLIDRDLPTHTVIDYWWIKLGKYVLVLLLTFIRPKQLDPMICVWSYELIDRDLPTHSVTDYWWIKLWEARTSTSLCAPNRWVLCMHMYMVIRAHWSRSTNAHRHWLTTLYWSTTLGSMYRLWAYVYDTFLCHVWFD